MCFAGQKEYQLQKTVLATFRTVDMLNGNSRMEPAKKSTHRGFRFDLTKFNDLQGKPRKVQHLFCFRVLCSSVLGSLNSLHRKMSSERMGLFWTFLDTGKFDKAMKCIASDFQYDALHSERLTTLLVEVSSVGMCKPPAEQQQCLELIKALRVGGASWTQPCRSKSSYLIWKLSDPEKSKINVNYGTHSALSFIQAWLRVLHKQEGFEDEVLHLHKVLEIYLEEPQPSRTKLPIDEDIVSKLRRSQVFCFFVAGFPNMNGENKNRIPHHWVWKAIPYPTWLNSYSYELVEICFLQVFHISQCGNVFFGKVSGNLRSLQSIGIEFKCTRDQIKVPI